MAALTPQQVANMGGQVWRFKDSIQVGDLVFRRLKEKRDLNRHRGGGGKLPVLS